MKQFLALAALVAVMPAAWATTCVLVPLEERVEAAQIVFVANVTSASASGPFSDLENGDGYRVTYSYEVRELIKGTPRQVESLFTVNTYHDYTSDLTIHSDETRLVPGDGVLVIADWPGDVQVASCTPSRPWSPSPEELQHLRSLAAPSNNSFKGMPLRGTP